MITKLDNPKIWKDIKWLLDNNLDVEWSVYDNNYNLYYNGKIVLAITEDFIKSGMFDKLVKYICVNIKKGGKK